MRARDAPVSKRGLVLLRNDSLAGFNPRWRNSIIPIVETRADFLACQELALYGFAFRQHQAVLYRAKHTLIALLDHAPVIACKHIKVVAPEGDGDLFFWEAFPGGNRLRDKFR